MAESLKLSGLPVRLWVFGALILYDIIISLNNPPLREIRRQDALPN